jgi:hypothetical protein
MLGTRFSFVPAGFKHAAFNALMLAFTPFLVLAQAGSTSAASGTELGRLANGAAVTFVRASTGDWGIEISGGGAPHLTQPKPAQIEVFTGPEYSIQQLAAGYLSVQREADTIVATTKLAGRGGAAFTVEDQWKVSGAVLSLSRKVIVTGEDARAGFFSAIRLLTAPAVKWEDADYFIPGLLYGDSSYAGGGAPSSVANYRAKRFSIREDYLSAPLFGISFRDGNWAAVLDLAPRGDTTQAENTAPATTPIIGERIQFGALGAREISDGGIELGFWLPGATTEIGGGRRGGASAGAPTPTVRRRYHPVKAGLIQSYQVAFRFDKSASFRDMQRDAWRWAWESLKPKVTPVDVEVVRRTLVDHLSDRVLTVEDRTGVPFELDAVTARPSRFADKIIMGFCGKNLEAADELLQEGDRDKTDRGQKMRKQGLAIIDSLVRIVPMSPPAGVGFSMQTGQPVPANFVPGFTLRMPSEDLAVLVNTYRREKKAGRDHPGWIKWVISYSDWLLTQQREDGSFPSAWTAGTSTVINDSGTTSYVPVPMLVRLSEETGQKRYLESAIKAADYIWTNFGSKGVFLGATGSAEVADKESGMLSLEAFLALYDNTKESRWLDRARFAADYTESWIWIWNVPMPLDADDARLHWKKGVPTIGVNGIGSNVPGGVDQYLDWSVASYAKLYKLTNDEHYLDVARVLLHGTKAMLALPGRTYDLLGPGWHQEHWNMGPGRKGMDAHRNWLVWVSVNHLHGITGLENLDAALYQRLAKGD